jgi:cbb3-type cytochrome oxidase subunit 3
MNQTVSMLTEYWLYWGVPLVFLVIVIWIYRPNAKKRYKADGSIPFEGDGNESKKRQSGR